MIDDIREYIKTLTQITDYKSLKHGDRIFNKESLSKDYVDIFDHLEVEDDGTEIIWYYNSCGELWSGGTGSYWFYIDR